MKNTAIKEDFRTKIRDPFKGIYNSFYEQFEKRESNTEKTVELPSKKEERNPSDKKNDSFDGVFRKILRISPAVSARGVDRALEKLMADTYALRLKAQNFCWNAKGDEYAWVLPEIEKEQAEMRRGVDFIADRIHEKNRRVPGTLLDLETLTSISEQQVIPSPKQMISLLKKGHKKVANQAQKVKKLARIHSDKKTESLAYQRMTLHRKMMRDLDCL